MEKCLEPSCNGLIDETKVEVAEECIAAKNV